jgi:iron complex outermembrane receptor protein
VPSRSPLVAFLALTTMTASAVAAGADEAATQTPLPEVLVIATTPLPGAAIDAEKVPGNVQTVSASELMRGGFASLTRALNSQLASVNIDATMDDPFQPDILYRGFEASPVLGTPEGLAVYQNGVRINEAFGDTVNWDLFPDFAIDSVQIVSSNPMYGLNALGAGMSIAMKNGFSYQDSDLELAYGSFEQRSVGLQYGAHSGSFGFYIAGRALDSSGWRDFSADEVRQLYSVLSYRTDRASLDLSYTGANNTLQGQGAAPVQELAVSRELTFTGPQDNRNRLNFLALNGSLEASDTLSVQGVLYDRHYSQSVANGNTTSYLACTQAPNLGSLCQSDGLTPVSGSSGQPLPDISAGGTLYIGENDWEMINAFGRGGGLQLTDSQPALGHTNQLSVGGSLDYASVNFQSGTQVGLIDPRLLVLPSNLYVATPENSPWGGNPVDLEVYNKYVGAYFTDTFDVTAALSLTASGRYNLANVDLEDRRGTQLTGNNRFTHFNPAFGGTYRLRSAVTLYAGWSANNRAPTASEIECSNPLTPCLLPSNLAGDPPNLRQVLSHTVELGARGSAAESAGAAGVLSWNLSVFRTNLHDDIYGIATSVSSGYFANIGATRRQGVEAGLKYRSGPWLAYVNLSYIQAAFRSVLLLPSPSNPAQDAQGNIQVEPGDRLPGIPLERGKAGIDYRILPPWTVGASLVIVSSQYYFGDESNHLAPMAGYHVVGLHTQYQPSAHCELFAALDNVLNARYATYGILSDPTGVGAPGIAVNAVTNGPGVDNRFLSPAPPFSVYGGVRFRF